MKTDKTDSGYPRVLVVDAVSFHRRTNTGILKSNFFQGWPSASLAQIILGHDRPDFSICNNYWRVTRRDRICAGAGKRVTRESAEKSIRSAIRKGPANRLRSQKRTDQLFAALGFLPWVTPIPITKEFRCWLTEFQPQVIFTIGATIGGLSVVRRLSDYFGIPVVPLFTDDWIGYMYRRGILDSFLRARLVETFNDCLQRSPVRMTVSEKMAEEYTRRYGGEFLPCMDLVTLDDWDYKPYRPRRGPVKFLFVGYLEPDRWSSLKLLGDSLRALRGDGLDVCLDIYTFPNQIVEFGPVLHSPPAVEVRGTVPPEQVSALLGEADVLVHAEAFGLRDAAMISLSFSTKIAQYMAAGRAILGIGPGDTASMQYVERSGGGIVVGQEDGQTLKEVVRRLACDADLRVRLAGKARQTAEANHDATVGRKRFKRILSEVAQSHS